MDHYNAACVAEALELDAGARSPIPREAEKFAYSFPEPARVWIDAPYDASAQIEAYRNLGNIQGKRIAQLGGKGTEGGGGPRNKVGDRDLGGEIGGAVLVDDEQRERAIRLACGITLKQRIIA